MSLNLLSVLVLAVFASGCGLHAQSYVMTKPRVNIEKGSGNAGYLAGTPQYVEPERKTRKVYVFEITKAIPEGEVKKIEQEISETTTTRVDTTTPEEPAAIAETNHRNVNHIVIPRIDDIPEPVQAAQGPSEDTVYTVQKDDTLQKIAKKHYGTYSAWLKIYNANKDKIKNPNFVRPGTVITLPAAK